MPRKSIAEYVADKRRAYAQAGSVKRSRLPDDTCEDLGYTRKYVIKLLTGNILYRERKGRGKTYDESVLANVRRIRETVGCPCTTYFVAELPRIVREYEECIAPIKPKEDREAILALSASTLDRAFKGLPHQLFDGDDQRDNFKTHKTTCPPQNRTFGTVTLPLGPLPLQAFGVIFPAANFQLRRQTKGLR